MAGSAPGLDLDEVDRVLGLAESRASAAWVIRTLPKTSSFESNSPATSKLGRAAGLAEQAEAVADFEAVFGGEASRRGSPGRRAGCAAPPAPLLPFDLDRLADVAGGRRDSARSAPLPSSFACSAERIVATEARPPAPCGPRRAAPAGIGEKPSLFWITSPPAKFSSTTWATELFSPAAKTVTKVTSARPIISAAAVTAVRLGLRWAFSRARRPSSRRTRSSGQPATVASGGTRRGLKSETAKTMATAPPPIRPAAVPAAALPKSPIRTIARPATPSSTASDGADQAAAAASAAA